MVRNILIVAASEAEAAIFMDSGPGSDVSGSFNFRGTKTTVVVTGIGTMACTRSLLNHFHRHGKPDLAVNAGIAGSFNPEMGIGSSAVYNPDLETMESASFFYICALEKVPFIAVRSISNMVEERNRDLWNVPLALQSLHEITKGIFRTII